MLMNSHRCRRHLCRSLCSRSDYCRPQSEDRPSHRCRCQHHRYHCHYMLVHYPSHHTPAFSLCACKNSPEHLPRATAPSYYSFSSLSPPHRPPPSLDHVFVPFTCCSCSSRYTQHRRRLKRLGRATAGDEDKFCHFVALVWESLAGDSQYLKSPGDVENFYSLHL
jgi:hypothetical protein